MQQLDDRVLRESGRVHCVADVQKAWPLLRSGGFDNVKAALEEVERKADSAAQYKRNRSKPAPWTVFAVEKADEALRKETAALLERLDAYAVKNNMPRGQLKLN